LLPYQAQHHLPVQRGGGEHAARLTRLHHTAHLGRGSQVSTLDRREKQKEDSEQLVINPFSDDQDS
jgi:hypothetical protein